MADLHSRAPILCAEQVEIFVPENAQIQFERVKTLLDELIFRDTIPFVEEEHKFWLKRLVDDYNAATHQQRSFENKTCWENLIFGYSVYQSNGYFVGPDEQLRRDRTAVYEEPTTVIKLIITNYLTPGVNYPVVHSAENPFWHMPQWMVSQAISPYRSTEAVSATAIRFEYSVMMLHYWGIIIYLFNQLSNDLMLKEEEIWIQRWPTQLSRRIRSDLRNVPIAANDEERQKKFGTKARDVLCVIDYVDV